MMDTAKRLRKKRARRAGGLMCCAGIIALAMVGQWAGPVEAPVQRVVDGDTLIVRYQGGNRTVRLIGVDTPESVHPTEPVEHFGLEASAFTKARLDGKTVQLVQDRTGDTVDAYGRLLRLICLDGANFNATLIREGYGHALCGFDYSMRREFIALENQARIQRRGLWAPRQVGLRRTQIGRLPFRLAALCAASSHRNTRYGGPGPFARPQEHPSSWTSSAVPIAGGNALAALPIAARHRPDHGSVAPLSASRCWVRWPAAPLAPDREPASRSLSIGLPFAGLARTDIGFTHPLQSGLAFAAVPG